VQTNHTFGSDPEVRKAWSNTCTPPYVFMACSVMKQTLNAQLYKPEEEGGKEQRVGGIRETGGKGN
jgi:hypothetical protein